MKKRKIFKGTVLLKEWVPTPTGLQVTAIHGKVQIYKAEELITFPPSRSESNWVATVKTEKNIFHILGCQIRSIVEGEWESRSAFR